MRTTNHQPSRAGLSLMSPLLSADGVASRPIDQAFRLGSVLPVVLTSGNGFRLHLTRRNIGQIVDREHPFRSPAHTALPGGDRVALNPEGADRGTELLGNGRLGKATPTATGLPTGRKGRAVGLGSWDVPGPKRVAIIPADIEATIPVACSELAQFPADLEGLAGMLLVEQKDPSGGQQQAQNGNGRPGAERPSHGYGRADRCGAATSGRLVVIPVH